KKFDRGRMEQTLAGLGNRIFLMNNVHEDEPVVFETRWCLSYLRGPLTRTQIKQLMDPVRAAQAGIGVSRADGKPAKVPKGSARPIVPPDVPQHFVPLRGAQPEGSELIYAPMLLGLSQVRFSDIKSGIDTTQAVIVLAPMSEGSVAVDWDRGTTVDV